MTMTGRIPPAMGLALALFGCAQARPSSDAPATSKAERSRAAPAVVDTCPPSPKRAQPAPPRSTAKGVVFETRSEFSRVRVKDEADTRKLVFVRENGEEDLQSAIDLRAPDQLEVAYLRQMAACFLLQPSPRRGLLIGLGGGSMVRFLNRFFPALEVDAVELDPEVVRVAKDYFGVSKGPSARVFIGDGARALYQPGPTYDVVFLDAFLVPDDNTDGEGAPEDLKGATFLGRVRDRLGADGLLVVNLASPKDSARDLRRLRAVFEQVYVFASPGLDNLVAIAAKSGPKRSREELRAAGSKMDRCADYGFSFAQLAATMVE